MTATGLLDLGIDTLAASSLYAPPNGQRYRYLTCTRGIPAYRSQIVGELAQARSRKLSFDLYGPATAECVVDGRSPDAAGLQELSQDLVVYRWDPRRSGYSVLFRGPIGRTEDSISETVHTVNVSAGDYRALFARCVLNTRVTYTQMDQDQIVSNLMATAGVRYGGTPPFEQGVYFATLNPDGTSRAAASGQLRDRTYTGAEKLGDMLDRLSLVINGFDYGIAPQDPQGGATASTGTLGVYYPQRGIVQPFVAEYGTTCASLTRTVNSTDFANWVRNDGQNNPDGTPMYAIAAGDVVTNPQLHPEGLWQEGISHADVNQQATLQQQADGELALASALMPSYTLVLVPGAWQSPADCWLGDTIGVRVRSGRLNVDSQVRILGVDLDVNDEETETVSLTVGRPAPSFADVLSDQRSRLDALSRR